jgi:FkbM family methyltransferase
MQLCQFPLNELNLISVIPPNAMYIDPSIFLATNEQIRTKIRSQSNVLLYGAGTIGRESHAILKKAGVLVEAFMDAKDLAFSQIQGVPVFKPDDLRFDAEKRRTTMVIVTIFNAYVDMPSIHSRLAALGWENIITFTAFYEAFSNELGNRYWLTSRDYYRPLDAQLAAARALWADDKSRTVYDCIIRFRLTGDYEALDKADFDSQYFPSDLPGWKTPLRLIDCGAYDGDTLRQVRNLGLQLEAYAAFEPDPANFTKLSSEVQSAPGGAPALTALLPCGAWSHGCQLSFSSGQGSGSAVNIHGDTVIQCAALDEVLPSFQPTLIKMDIEGAELAALLGAADTIRKCRPGLAICLYHEPAHLWQIPLLIAGWDLSYRFYLRCHYHNGFELVLYAIPT